MKLVSASDDFYSTQLQLRQEQQRLLSLLKDETLPLMVPPKRGPCKKDKRTENGSKVELEDGCEMARKSQGEASIIEPFTLCHFALYFTKVYSFLAHPLDGKIKTSKIDRAGTAETHKKLRMSQYHVMCSPEEPNRKFRATPAPKGILKGKYINLANMYLLREQPWKILPNIYLILSKDAQWNVCKTFHCAIGAIAGKHREQIIKH